MVTEVRLHFYLKTTFKTITHFFLFCKNYLHCTVFCHNKKICSSEFNFIIVNCGVCVQACGYCECHCIIYNQKQLHNICFILGLSYDSRAFNQS